MKKFRKLIPALALLLVSAVLMSTASYAWFSMNNKVAVTGMEVKTKVSSNLLISPDTAGSTTKNADSTFKSSLEQEVKGLLEPVSTADAKAFFYTVDAKADGDRTGSSAFYTYDSSAVASDATTYADKFSEVYGVSKTAATAEFNNRAVAYVDYIFQLKASNTTGNPQYIIINKLDLTYNTPGSEEDNNTAFRVAFFYEDITSTASGSVLPGTTAQLKVTSSANFNDEVINSATPATQAVGYATSADGLITVPGDSTDHYYKVTIRMWLEGQDKTCNNTTFMKLTGDWTLDLEYKIQANATGAVTAITSAVPTP